MSDAVEPTTKKRRRVPGSRRELKERKKAEKEERVGRFKASSRCIRDFSESHTGNEALVSVLGTAFRVCGEPILKYLKLADNDIDVPAARTGKWLVQMGLIRPDHYASSFGGVFDISDTPLKELRKLAKEAGIAGYTKTRDGVREYISVEQLREACRPLVYMSPQIFKATVTDVARIRTIETLRALDRLPEEDERVERELNRRVMAYSVKRLFSDIVHYTLGIPREVFSDGNEQSPVAYRPSLALYASDIWADFKGRPRVDREIATNPHHAFGKAWNVEVNIRRDILHSFPQSTVFRLSTRTRQVDEAIGLSPRDDTT